MPGRQSLIALGIAIVLAIVAVYAANVFLTRNQSQAAKADERTTKVAVAAVPLDYGVEVTPEKIRFVQYPVNSIPAGAYSNIGQLLPAGKKRVALRPIQVNEPVLASKLAGEGLTASLSALLPDGMRATTVRINDVSGVAGFIQPNDAVDVLITRDLETGGGSRQVTDVLLQNTKVLAMGANSKGKDGQAISAKSATLQVDPIDAQKLVLGERVGSLSLVLRKPGEQNNPLVETVSLEDLRYSMYGGARYAQAPVRFGAPTQVAQVARPRAVRRSAPAPKPVNNSVEIVRGMEGRNYEVGDYGS